MSTPDRLLGFTYRRNGQVIDKSLTVSYLDEYNAKLTNPVCEDSGVKVDIFFDHTVVNYLEQIKDKFSDYYFQFDNMIWYINPFPTDNHSGYLFGFISGDMIYDGSKIICTNPILNPVLQNIPNK
jgi:hypothetical protein